MSPSLQNSGSCNNLDEQIRQLKSQLPPCTVKKPDILVRYLSIPVGNPEWGILSDIPSELQIRDKIEWVLARRGVHWDQYNPPYKHKERKLENKCPLPGCTVAKSHSPEKHVRTANHAILLAKVLAVPIDTFYSRFYCEYCDKTISYMRTYSLDRHKQQCQKKLTTERGHREHTDSPRHHPYPTLRRPSKREENSSFKAALEFQTRWQGESQLPSSHIHSALHPSHPIMRPINGRPQVPDPTLTVPRFSAEYSDDTCYHSSSNRPSGLSSIEENAPLPALHVTPPSQSFDLGHEQGLSPWIAGSVGRSSTVSFNASPYPPSRCMDYYYEEFLSPSSSSSSSASSASSLVGLLDYKFNSPARSLRDPNCYCNPASLALCDKCMTYFERFL